MHDATYDVVVVGARVAGASTALLLARAGLRVALLERAAYGSDTAVHARADARRRPAAVPVGPARPARRGRHAAGAAARCSTTDGEPRHRVSIRRSAGVDALYAPRRTVLDRAARGRRRRGRCRASSRRRPVTDLRARRRPRRAASRPRRAQGRTATLRARLTIGADGIGSVVAAGAPAPTSCAGAAASARPVPLPRRPPGGGLRVGVRRRAPLPGVIPTNDGRDLRLRRHHGRPDAGSCAVSAPTRPSPRCSIGPLPRSPTGSRAARPRAAAARLGRRARGSSAARAGRAGRWSGTPATSRTRSPPTASPTRCGTPSCSPTRVVGALAGAVPEAVALAALPGDPRPALAPAVRRHRGGRRLRLGQRTSSQALLRAGQLGDERRGRAPARRPLPERRSGSGSGRTRPDGHRRSPD